MNITIVPDSETEIPKAEYNSSELLKIVKTENQDYEWYPTTIRGRLCISDWL